MADETKSRERFDLAFRKVLTVSKEQLLKEEAKQQEKRRAKKKR